MSLVEVRSLTRRFGAFTAVDDVSFSFEAGQIFGFIGPNGAGKSTTMRILATLDLPSSGDCLIDGLSTVDDPEKVRRLIGYMPDSYGTYPNMTVLEYLDFFARAHGLAIEPRRRAVADVVDFCQLGGLSDKLITTLSKGMKQRLCLGRGLIHDPRVLILDEPSAGLDPRARIELRDLLRALAKQGKAVFISSHILAELEELCDGVAIIEQGRLIATGTVAEVAARARQARAAATTSDTASACLVEVHLASAHADFARVLAEQPGVVVEACTEQHASIRVSGDAAAHAALLKRLMDAGVPVCAFAARADNLEDMFMHLTAGRVS